MLLLIQSRNMQGIKVYQINLRSGVCMDERKLLTPLFHLFQVLIGRFQRWLHHFTPTVHLCLRNAKVTSTTTV